MKTLYLDIFSGISGDMFIGALLDLGLEFDPLRQELSKLGLDQEYHLHVGRAHKSSIEGVKFDVHVHSQGDHSHDDHGHSHSDSHPHPHEHKQAHSHPHSHPGSHSHSHSHSHDGSRDYAQIKQLIHNSLLSDWVKEKAARVFHRIAVAEGKVHGMPPDQVHFHEVGAIDSIVDIVGACAGLELLGKPAVLAAPVVEGTGWVDCAHGRFPVPTTATLEILGTRGIPVTQCDEPHELVTPTGAALLAEFVQTFGPMQGLRAERIGYGLGTRNNHTRPNVLRAVLGQAATSASTHDWETDSITVLETNLDDMNPEILGYITEKALAAGALDVFHTSIQMKKNRPATLLSILCPAADADALTELILRETTAFGVRRHSAERRKLRREIKELETAFGPVTVKLGSLDGKVVKISPEYESCRKMAETRRLPLQAIYEAAHQAGANLLGQPTSR